MTEPDDSLDRRYLAAVAALEREDWEGARRGFQWVLADAPGFAPAWDGLGSCHAAEGNLGSAEECYRRSMRLDRGGWRSRFNWGLALHRAGKLDEALPWLAGAAKLAPEERLIRHRLGLCYFDRGELDRALKCFRKALELPERHISDAELYLQIGKTECERGEYEAADKAYQRACLLSPDNGEIYYHWAVLTTRTGTPEEAERLAVRARALGPEPVRALRLLIDLSLDARRWDRARHWIDELAQVPEMSRLALACHAECAWRMGDPSAAEALALEALRAEGFASDGAVDDALAILRKLDGIPCRGGGYRILLEVRCGDHSYYRPFVVLAGSEEQARGFVARIQNALDDAPWEVSELEEFPHEEEALAGVYHLQLKRVLFPVEQGPGLM